MKDERLYLVHMIECGERILSYTQLGREAFLRDTKTQDAVVRNFEIIGEAAKRVPQATRNRAPNIPWGASRVFAMFSSISMREWI